MIYASISSPKTFENGSALLTGHVLVSGPIQYNLFRPFGII